VRRLLTLLLLAGALLPASAIAEPVGSPFRFGAGQPVVPADDEVGATGGLSLASAVNGYVLASWTSSPRPTSSTTQVLGRTAPLEAPRELAQGSGAVAANPRLRRYLRVSEQVTDNGGYGIFTQRLRSNGTAEGPLNAIQTAPGSVSFFDPDAVYNPRTRQYLIVGRVGDESGVFGQGWLADERGRRIRSVERCCTGTHAPEVAVRPSDGSYLIVNTDDFQREDEPRRDPTIGYQWLSATGASLSGSTLATTDADARVAVNDHTGEALVVWSDGSQVIARRIGADGRPAGGEMALSQMGAPSDPDWRTGRPDVAYNAEAKQFLVVWQSGPRGAPYPIGDHVYGQHLDGSGREIGPNDFRISEGDRAQAPRVSSVRSSKDWLVAWGDPTGVARQVTATTQGTPPDGGGAAGRRHRPACGRRSTAPG
jgi:hypothetical protein